MHAYAMVFTGQRITHFRKHALLGCCRKRILAPDWRNCRIGGLLVAAGKPCLCKCYGTFQTFRPAIAKSLDDNSRRRIFAGKGTFGIRPHGTLTRPVRQAGCYRCNFGGGNTTLA